MVRGIEFHEIINNIFDEDVKGIGDSEQLQVCCPRCQERDGLFYPDGKYNLEINTAKRVFRCWKCDEPRFTGSLGRLIKTYGTNMEYEVYKSYASIFKDYEYDEDEKEFVQVKLPSEMIYFSQMDASDPDHFEAYNYLVNDRQIKRDVILRYRIGFCTTGKYAGRIIIPSFDNDGEVNYFVARTYKNAKVPYLNPKVDKGMFIFNEGMINWDSTIYLVEGVFEMLSLTVNAIPLLGKDLLDALYFKLKALKPNVVVLLDPDAHKAAVDLIFKLKTIYAGVEERVKIVVLPGKKDLDEERRAYGDDKVLEALRSARDLNVDDYFIKSLKNPYEFNNRNRRYKSYSEFMQRR